MDKNMLVRKLEGYAPLSYKDKADIRDLCSEEVVVVEAKKDIISDGDRPDHIHLILDGWAARCKLMPDGTRQITALLMPGDFCDLHITVLAEMDHSITALTKCRVANLDTEKLDQMTTDRSMLTKALWWMTLVDEAVLRQWVINARRQAIPAVAHLLCELHRRMSSVGMVEGKEIELPLTQQELADATGMSPVHMNRTIQTMRRENLIELKNSKLRIPDINRLADAGGFDDSYLHLRKDTQRRGEQAA